MSKPDNVNLLVKGHHILVELSKSPTEYVSFRNLRKLDLKQGERDNPPYSTGDLLDSLVSVGFIDKKTMPARYRIEQKGQVALEKFEELRDVCK